MSWVEGSMLTLDVKAVPDIKYVVCFFKGELNTHLCNIVYFIYIGLKRCSINWILISSNQWKQDNRAETLMLLLHYFFLHLINLICLINFIIYINVYRFCRNVILSLLSTSMSFSHTDPDVDKGTELLCQTVSPFCHGVQMVNGATFGDVSLGLTKNTLNQSARAACDWLWSHL